MDSTLNLKQKKNSQLGYLLIKLINSGEQEASYADELDATTFASKFF
jgi:hypothetical protein